MGDCYSTYTEFRVKPLMKDALVKALNRKFSEDSASGIRFCLELFEKKPDMNTVEGLMAVIYAGHQGDYSCEHEGDAIVVSNAFDASYGWYGVMDEWFSVMAPFLEDGSYLEIFADSGNTRYEVKDGKVSDNEIEEDED